MIAAQLLSAQNRPSETLADYLTVILKDPNARPSHRVRAGTGRERISYRAQDIASQIELTRVERPDLTMRAVQVSNPRSTHDAQAAAQALLNLYPDWRWELNGNHLRGECPSWQARHSQQVTPRPQHIHKPQ